MKHLPLYTDRRAAIERSAPIADVDPQCKRCKLSEGVRSVCLPADGHDPNGAGFTGALLVLTDYPTEPEDAARRPASAGPNSALRDVIERVHAGAVVYASAMRCAPKHRNVSDAMVAACSGYTHGLIKEVKPSRILCFGKRAYQMVLGSSCDSVQLGRRGYGYLSDETPVYMLHAARRVTPNRFLLRRWEADIEWAVNGPLPALPPWDGVVELIETPEDARLAASVLDASSKFTYDTETGGLMGSDYFQVVCLAATPSNDLDRSFVWTEEALQDPATLEPLRGVLSDVNALKIGHNLKYDFEAVGYGLNLRDASGVLQVRGVGFDTLLTVKTLDTESAGGLDLADHHVGMGGHKAENKAALDAAVDMVNRARAKPTQRRLPGTTHPALEAAVAYPDADAKAFAYALVPREILYRYCALDTAATARLAAHYEPIVDAAPHLRRVRDTLHNPATAAIAQIESWGMSADVGVARAFGRLLQPRLVAAEREIRALGCDVDISSSKQLSAYLFGDLELPVQELTKTGQASTNAASLSKLKGHHPVIQHLLDHAKISKLLSTYVTGLIPHVRPDGRIRSSLNIAGARSGRMSSSNPNLQNIPSTGEFAKMAKNIFNAPEGHVLLQLDYSQLEVRIAAVLSGEPGLIEAYKEGVDVHRRTASKAFNVAESDVTKDQRREAKGVVFGVMYGKSPNSLAREWGTPLAHGQFVYDSVLGAYPVLSRWMEERRRYVDRYGTAWTYLTTPQGIERARCRQLWQIAEPDGAAQSRARNGSVNTPIQGTASDFMLRTLCAVVDWLIADGIPARVTNTVHDSIILEAPYSWALEVAAVVKGIMEAWPSGDVPLVADVDVGHTWGALHNMNNVRLVANARRQGLSDDEIIHVAKADPDAAEEMGSDPRAWLAAVSDLANKLGA